MEFDLIIERGEDGYLISEVVGLPGCHTQAKNMDELIERTKEAISLYLDEEKQRTGKINFVNNFLGVQKISL